MKKPRNPVARAPILRKGGAHQKSPSAQRAKVREAIRRALKEKPDAERRNDYPQ
ncbi:MAG: hypothetical protein M3Z21_17535 [Pseudomonadota bacterium]|nr:hypothetical protein [Pseudomonadota bacterium]